MGMVICPKHGHSGVTLISLRIEQVMKNNLFIEEMLYIDFRYENKEDEEESYDWPGGFLLREELGKAPLSGELFEEDDEMIMVFSNEKLLESACGFFTPICAKCFSEFREGKPYDATAIWEDMQKRPIPVLDALTVYKNPAELARNQREPLLDYEKHYVRTHSLLRLYNAILNNNNPNLSSRELRGMSHSCAGSAMIHLLIAYSAGNPLDELRALYPLILHYWGEFAKHDDPSPRDSYLDIYDYEYEEANHLICLALLLGWAEFMPKIAAILDRENKTHDILLETYLRFFLPDRPKGAEYTRGMPYCRLHKVFSAIPDERPVLMAEYLDGWYQASCREIYYDSHKEGAFHGYWAWEAAAITWLYEIDDTVYRNKPFYPADIVDYARAQYTPKQAAERVALNRINLRTN